MAEGQSLRDGAFLLLFLLLSFAVLMVVVVGHFTRHLAARPVDAVHADPAAVSASRP